MAINVPLLRKTLEFITAHPEEHKQEVWAQKTSCGTACCLAGWAVQLAGHELRWDVDVPTTQYCANGREIAEMAAVELGLSDDEVSLFDAYYSLANLWHLAHHYTGGEIEIPEEFL